MGEYHWGSHCEATELNDEMREARLQDEANAAAYAATHQHFTFTLDQIVTLRDAMEYWLEHEQVHETQAEIEAAQAMHRAFVARITEANRKQGRA